MKLVKTTNWIRLRGQVGPKNEICKIDTPVTDKERVFFCAGNRRRKKLLSIDMALQLTGIPYGPSSHNPDDPCGWRFYANRTEADMMEFATTIKQMMENVYNEGLAHQRNKKPILN